MLIQLTKKKKKKKQKWGVSARALVGLELRLITGTTAQPAP